MSEIKDRSSPEAIGERICALRKSKELTQASLAKLCGISQQTIGALESGRVSDPRHLPIIGQMLNVSVEYLRYGRAKGVPILSSTVGISSLPREGEDIDPSLKMLPMLGKHSVRAFAYINEETACRAEGVFPGDLVVVDPAAELTPGGLVCVRYMNKMCVRIYKDAGERIYVATNDNYATLGDDTCDFVGVVIQITRMIIK